MRVDSVCNGVATIEGYEDSKLVLLLRECGMYKANDNSRALAKALYNTNKSFRTSAKVKYNTRAKVLYFPRPIVFPLAYAFIGQGTILEGV